MHHRTQLFCLIALACSLWGSSLAKAEKAVLVFENKLVEVTADPNQKKITISFPFKNLSKETIEITKHDAPCACIGATFKDGKKIYAPGETGELSATFKLGNFFGVTDKQILLWQRGDAQNKPSILLTCKVTIPELFTITPRTLSWDLNSEAAEQTCTLTVNYKEPIHVTDSMITNRNFEFKVETIRDGWEYKLTVKPKKTNTPTFGILRVSTDSTNSRYKRGQAFVYIRRNTQ